MSTLKGVEPELATGDDGNQPPWGDIAVFFLWPLGLYLLWKQPRAFASHLKGLAAFSERRAEPELTTTDSRGGLPWIGLAAFLLWPLGLYLLLKQPRAFASHLRGLAAFSESENKMDVTKGEMRELANDDGEGIKPLYIGLAIFLVWPLGLYLLWRHPRLGRNKAWWWVGGIWSFIFSMAVIGGDKDKKPSADKAVVAETATARPEEVAVRPPTREVESPASERPKEVKRYKVSKGWGRSVTIELPDSYDVGLDFKDFNYKSDSGQLEFTAFWNSYRSKEPMRRWEAFDSEGVAIESGNLFFTSIRSYTPTRGHITFRPDTWKNTKRIVIE